MRSKAKLTDSLQNERGVNFPPLLVLSKLTYQLFSSTLHLIKLPFGQFNLLYIPKTWALMWPNEHVNMKVNGCADQRSA